MTVYQSLIENLRASPRSWLITGVAGFIGANLLETLLRCDQKVIGLDNFATGYRHNLESVRSAVKESQWSRFDFVEGDINDLDLCLKLCVKVDHVLHQAAIGSVPRSIDNPVFTNRVNIDGFLNMLMAAKDAGVGSFTYAASSSTYGDHPGLPKKEDEIGKPLSPYAVTKYVNELYADVFRAHYGLQSTGLRYFNVFGKYQDPDGAYAAVIPKWTAAMIRGETVFINGDGESSRDFCFIDNAVQANLLAATAHESARGEVYNVAVGERTSLTRLFEIIRESLAEQGVQYDKSPVYRDFRPGDVRHSQADVSKAGDKLGYVPTVNIEQGIAKAMCWYVANL